MSYQIKDTDGYPVQVKGQHVYGSDFFDGEIKDVSMQKRSFLAVASKESSDRMGDVVRVRGIDLRDYRKNRVVMPFHNYSMLPVGKSLGEFVRESASGDELVFRPQFARYKLADTMFQLYTVDKILKGFSIGFIARKTKPIEEVKDEGDEIVGRTPTRFITSSLLEVSVAPIPCHQDALAEIKGLVTRGKLQIDPRLIHQEWHCQGGKCYAVPREYSIPTLGTDDLSDEPIFIEEDRVIAISYKNGVRMSYTRDQLSDKINKGVKTALDRELGRLEDESWT